MANRNVLINEDSLISVADAVRTLTETSIGYRVADMSSALSRVSSDSEAPIDGKSVIFIDYDGFVTNSYTAAEAQALTALPDNPSHPGLTSQGWNWTLPQIKSYLINYPAAIITVGQLYATESGKTEIDIELKDANFLSPYLSFALNGTCTIDWGDESSTDSVTGTSITVLKYTQHTYSATGNYTIKVDGPLVFYSANVTDATMLKERDSITFQGRAYSGCVKAVRVGTSVTTIGQYAFSTLYNLKYVTMPNTVTTINKSAFEKTGTIKAITFPSINAINTYLVQQCSALKFISFPPSIVAGVIGNYAFSSCYSLYSVAIPSGITSIGENAFRYSYYLKNVTIPSTVTEIKQYAFDQCYNLNTVIPNSVQTIAQYAFQTCYSLTAANIPSGVTTIPVNTFASCYSLRSLTIPNTVTTIGNSAFNTCAELAELTFSTALTSIGTSLIANCKALTEVSIPSGITTVPASFASGCSSLVSVTIPNTVTSIGNSAFENCVELLTITIPSTVTTIGTNLLKGNKKLTTVTISGGITTINNGFVYNCSALTSISIPNTVTTINGDAFRACTSLKNITIPASVTTIANNAFYGNNKMEEYHFQSTTPPTLGGTNAFNGIPSTCKIYVPAASLSAYQAATNWKNQAAKMVGE